MLGLPFLPGGPDGKLRREGTPWSGTNAAADFSPEWEELPAAEREKYERRATEK